MSRSNVLISSVLVGICIVLDSPRSAADDLAESLNAVFENARAYRSFEIIVESHLLATPIDADSNGLVAMITEEFRHRIILDIEAERGFVATSFVEELAFKDKKKQPKTTLQLSVGEYRDGKRLFKAFQNGISPVVERKDSNFIEFRKKLRVPVVELAGLFSHDSLLQAPIHELQESLVNQERKSLTSRVLPDGMRKFAYEVFDGKQIIEHFFDPRSLMPIVYTRRENSDGPQKTFCRTNTNFEERDGLYCVSQMIVEGNNVRSVPPKIREATWVEYAGEITFDWRHLNESSITFPDTEKISKDEVSISKFLEM